MKQTILLIIVLTCLSCSKNPEEAQEEFIFPDYSFMTDEFEKELSKTLERLKEKGNDSILTPIKRDTLYLFTMKNSKVFSGLAQYRTKDNKLKLGIIGIGNIRNEYPPTFVLVDMSAKLYIADSSFVQNDSLYIFGRIKRESETESLKVGFDLNFDGSSFPWTFD